MCCAGRTTYLFLYTKPSHFVKVLLLPFYSYYAVDWFLVCKQTCEHLFYLILYSYLFC